MQAHSSGGGGGFPQLRHRHCCLSYLRAPHEHPHMILCSPFVVHLKPALTELAKEYQAKGVKIVAISSNSTETHPQVGSQALTACFCNRLPQLATAAGEQEQRWIRHTAALAQAGSMGCQCCHWLPPCCGLPGFKCRLYMAPCRRLVPVLAAGRA